MKTNAPSLRFPTSANKFYHLALLLAVGCLVPLCGLAPARAASFFSDFNSGSTPAGTTLYPNAVIETTGGFTNSGCLKLTKASGTGQGGWIINDLDAGQPVVGF